MARLIPTYAGGCAEKDPQDRKDNYGRRHDMNRSKANGLQILGFLFLFTTLAYGQAGGSMVCDCPSMMKTLMQHPGGILVIILAALLLIAAIAFLTSLSVFFIRRSRG